MTTITIRQRTAAGTQDAGREYLQRVKSFLGRIVDGLNPHFGPMSLDQGSLLVRDKLAVNQDVIRLMRM